MNSYKLLSNKFLDGYTDFPVSMTPIGMFTYLRTYSRWITEESRRETWKETVARAVEYNCSLSPNTTEEEARELFDVVFNLKGFLSGRTLWIGGTPTVEKHALANFNCSGVVLDGFDKLSELFYALMCGTGVGFRTTDEDVKYLPKMRKIDVIHEKYQPVKKADRLESTELGFTLNNTTAIITVGDSKEGWVQSLHFFFDIVTKKEYRHITDVVFVYDHVRPKGERLVNFGGTASGYESLKKMYSKMVEIINRDNEALRAVKTIDMMDFANIIAENVVVGGVRRSAEIGLIGAEDTECITAKNSLYTQDENGVWDINQEISHRCNSNNTIIHWERPSREFWHWQFEQMRFSGEPAFYNGEHAAKRKPNFHLTNPCGEILLDDRQTCNLVTTNILAHVKSGKLNLQDLKRTHALLTRASYRMTMVELELPEWDKMLHRDRLLGVSLTGWQDMVNAVNMDRAEQRRILQVLRDVARKAADEIADNLGLNRSELVTTVKPEGTLSLLPTVSSGLHFSHSEYFIRRIRINATDALVKVCKELGYPVYPEVGQEMETANTLVVEFPVQAPAGRTKSDVSAIEQLEIYTMFMENYVDHNASITVHVRENEWEEAEQWVYDNWDSCIGISFLALDDSYYQLLPFEAISREEYTDRAVNMMYFDSELLKKYEREEEEHEEAADGECASGACPIR